MMNASADTSDIERLRRLAGRIGIAIAVPALVIGTVLFLAGRTQASSFCFQAAFVVLIALPVKNVLAVLADEVRRRDWWFAVIAIAVLAELSYAVFDRLR